MRKTDLRWWEWPVALITGPFIIGLFAYLRWDTRRWEKAELRRQERWVKDHPDWYGDR